MKRIMFAGLVLAVSHVAAPALAADLPTKAPPMVAPIYNWNGWYGGVNVGYGGGNESDRETVFSGAGFPIIGAGTLLYNGPNTFRLSPQGVIGGVQAGYHWQTSANMVLGLEADIQGSGIKDSIGCVLGCGTPVGTVPGPFPLQFFPVVFAADSYTHKIDWFGTVRGRIGYANGPTMVYLTGGLAYGDVERSAVVAGRSTFLGAGTVNTFAGSYGASTTKVGWTVGFGGEAKLLQQEVQVSSTLARQQQECRAACKPHLPRRSFFSEDVPGRRGLGAGIGRRRYSLDLALVEYHAQQATRR